MRSRGRCSADGQRAGRPTALEACTLIYHVTLNSEGCRSLTAQPFEHVRKAHKTSNAHPHTTRRSRQI
jgi:hypothetical protein